MNQKLHLLLGQAGDILTALPFLWLDSQSGNRPALMVAKEHAGLLDGVSYCDCVSFDGKVNELEKAYSLAKHQFEEVVACQVAGPPDAVKRYVYEPTGTPMAVTDCFEKEVFRAAGRFGDWHNSPPLVFDRRDREREEALIKQVLPNGKKVILLAASGKSSPFPYRPLLLELLKLKFGRTYQIVDISSITAERFYDLIGLYEHPNVHCVVATDSAPLHLAYAAKVPTVAIVQDKPGLWYGSAWRSHHVAHIRYGDFAARAVEMLDAISTARKPGSVFYVNGSPAPQPRLIHVWNTYELNENNRERATKARKQWCEQFREEPQWIETPIELGAVGQDSKTALKDTDRFPLFKDAMNLALLRAKENDLIVVTRCDTLFREGLTDRLTALSTPAFGLRNISMEEGLQYHPAADLFAFTKKWWVEHRVEYPDLVWGLDTFWSRVLAELIKKHGGIELCEAVTREPGKVVPFPEAPKYVAYNEKSAIEWFEKNAIPRTVPMVSEQLPTVPINRRALYNNGYNPSIIQHSGGLLMSYRWHSRNTLETRLAMAEMSEAGAVSKNADIVIPTYKEDGENLFDSQEDCRLFHRGNELWASYTSSFFGPNYKVNCAIRYGRLVHGKAWTMPETFRIKYGQNDGTSLEKNFVFFDRNGKLYCIYRSRPEQVILEVIGENVVAEHVSKSPRWKWGDTRGDTTPLPFQGKLLRFFHSRLDNEAPPWVSRYYVGAAVMEPEPPFQTIAISKSPILLGSDADDLSATEKFSCFHYKPQVVFPCGAINYENGFLLSVGINDAACSLVKITEKDLNL